MKPFRLLLTLFSLLCLLSAAGQIRLEGWNAPKIAPRLHDGLWPAQWITAPDAGGDYDVCHFRKGFSLERLPGHFLVHVSADNRYKLFVNGRLVSLGPALGDVYNWNFETVDLAPYLVPGRNVLAVVVWHFGEKRPLAQMTFGSLGFLLQGNTPAEDVVNTDASWRCLRNTAYAPCEEPVLGYYAAGACEQVDASRYPWGWEQPSCDDSAWVAAEPLQPGAMKGAADYPGRQLVPTPIQPMEYRPIGAPRLRRVAGVAGIGDAGTLTFPIVVAAQTQAELLLDYRVLHTGYPTLRFRGGKDAEIEIGYAESLFDRAETGAKGHRDSVAGKLFVGYADRIVADGGAGRSYTPLWWRTWRYVRLRVAAGREPLVIEGLEASSSMYPFVRESAFEAPEWKEAGRILRTGWRTARLCANETYMDCPYYEQLQYFGDTRIQALISLYNTRNDEMVRQALEQGRRSLSADGITMSRYPSSLHQFIPSFSLWWICAGHDYWRYRGDESYLASLLPAYRSVLAWFETFLNPDGSLGRIPYWFFVDWSGTHYGEPVRERDGHSSIQDLHFLLALEAAADMEAAFGSAAWAAHYREIAASVRAGFAERYWDAGRGLFADTPSRQSFSQHANVLALLARIVEGEEAAALFDRMADDPSLIPCTIYFRYYLHQAMKIAGRGDQFIRRLDLWRDQLNLGLSTWAEQPEPSRSDCHAWGASPNIEVYRILLGIDSDAPGFRKIRIAPALGSLHEASGSIPHPQGQVSVAYERTDGGPLKARISIPDGTTGVFIWNGREYPLVEGEQTIVAR